MPLCMVQASASHLKRIKMAEFMFTRATKRRLDAGRRITMEPCVNSMCTFWDPDLLYQCNADFFIESCDSYMVSPDVEKMNWLNRTKKQEPDCELIDRAKPATNYRQDIFHFLTDNIQSIVTDKNIIYVMDSGDLHKLVNKLNDRYKGKILQKNLLKHTITSDV